MIFIVLKTLFQGSIKELMGRSMKELMLTAKMSDSYLAGLRGDKARLVT